MQFIQKMFERREVEFDPFIVIHEEFQDSRACHLKSLQKSGSQSDQSQCHCYSVDLVERMRYLVP